MLTIALKNTLVSLSINSEEDLTTNDMDLDQQSTTSSEIRIWLTQTEAELQQLNNNKNEEILQFIRQ